MACAGAGQGAAVREGLMTVVEPVLTVTGMCGNTMLYHVNGTLVAFTCDHSVESSHKSPPPYSSIRKYTGTGFGGGTALGIIRTIDNLARDGRSDDHLLVLKPDGSVGNDPQDYHGLLDAHQHRQISEDVPIDVDLGDQVQSFLSHDLDPDARPFVLVSPPSFGAIGAHHLEPALRAAADMNAPLWLLTL